jgi:hypothetical protein
LDFQISYRCEGCLSMDLLQQFDFIKSLANPLRKRASAALLRRR